MENNSKHCAKCGQEISYEPCQHCGHISHVASPNELQTGAILNGSFIIQRTLGSGGFGITYQAYHYFEKRMVAIKEYCPKAISSRGEDGTSVICTDPQLISAYEMGCKKFYEEACLISSFSHYPGIVRIEGFFNENNTSYMVMEYLEGTDLRRYLEKRGTLGNGQMTYIMNHVIAALRMLHNSNVLHRDVAPDNIFLCNDGAVKLIDFGAARNVVSNQHYSLSVIIKEGFAPMEQYSRNGVQGPWTDIYSLGATAFYALTGRILDIPTGPHCHDRFLEQLRGTSPFYHVIKKCTECMAKDRYQNVDMLAADLNKLRIDPVPVFNGSVPVSPHSGVNQEPKKHTEFRESGKTSKGLFQTGSQLPLILAVTGVTLLLMILILVLLSIYA